MRDWRRRVRGAIGMGFTWAAACFLGGIAMAFVTGFTADVPFPLVFGVFGFAGGVIFSTLLALAEGRHRFDQMSLPRFAGWGAAGGLLLSAIFTMAASFNWGDAVGIALTFSLVGAVCAAGSLAVARRAAQRELPDPGVDASERPFTDREKPRLPPSS